MNVIRHNFPATQYVSERTEKRQIVLHHTASGPGVDGDIAWWMKTPERVATHFIVDREGGVHQLFDEGFWGYHLGLAQKVFTQMKLPYKQLDRQSIGIEIDSWGYLEPHTDDGGLCADVELMSAIPMVDEQLLYAGVRYTIRMSCPFRPDPDDDEWIDL